MTRRPLFILAAFAIVFTLLLSPVAGWGGGGGNANYQYGDCDCHGSVNSATMGMSASSLTLAPGEQVTVTVTVSGGQGTNNIIGVMLLSKLSGSTGTLPQENGWTILANGGGQPNNYYEIDRYTGSASFTWTLKAPAATGTFKLYAKLENSAGTAYTKDYAAGLSFSVTPTGGAAPSVKITSPSNGDIVSGPLTVTANIAPGTGQTISSTELRVDGSLIGADTSPYSWTVDTLGLSNGIHTINVTAVDGTGLRGYDQITVVISNSPLSVVITSPSNGARVVGSVEITLTASGQQSISNVEVSVDGTRVTTLTSAPYSYLWNTVPYADGQHTVTVTATDSGGASVSQSIVVTTNNQGTAVEVPAVVITDPLNNALVSGEMTVNATVSSAAALALVELTIDGQAVGSATGGPYRFTFDSSDFQDGAHRLEVAATDVTGAIGRQAISLWFSNPSPVVLITSLENNTLVSGEMTIEGVLIGGASEIQLLVDGTLVASRQDGNLSFEVDTSRLTNGAHVINVTAIDGQDRAGSAQLIVIVSNLAWGGGYHPPAQFGWSTMDMVFLGVIALLVIALVAGRRWKR